MRNDVRRHCHRRYPMHPKTLSPAFSTRVRDPSVVLRSARQVLIGCVVIYGRWPLSHFNEICWQSTIFPKVGEMGANTTAAFTDYVTHLIAEEHGGAKYWVGSPPLGSTLSRMNTIPVRG